MTKLLRHRRLMPSTLVGVAALAFAATSPVTWGQDDDDDGIPFAEAEIFFELNNTDGDLGIHALIDGEPWKKLEIEDPNEREMLDATVRGRLRKQGLTELFFESAEPTFDELSPEEFFERFPEGKYEVEGETLEGEKLESETDVTHTMPAPPITTVNDVPEAVQCDKEEPGYPAPVVGPAVTIAWTAITTSHPDLGTTGVEVDIVNYEVVVETLGEVDAVLSVIVPPDVTQITIPGEFLALSENGDVKYEVLAREESFNQTATESCFQL